MADAYHHAVSSARQWGGQPEDYIHIHRWFDETKMALGDFRHRAGRHHTDGVNIAVQLFGDETGCITIEVQRGLPNGAVLREPKRIPVRWIAERHVVEDMGRLIAAHEWWEMIPPDPRLNRPSRLSRQLEKEMAAEEAAANQQASDDHYRDSFGDTR